jgi:hypothetical protein
MSRFALLVLSFASTAAVAAQPIDPSSSLLGCYTSKGHTMDMTSQSPTLEQTLNTLNIIPTGQFGQFSANSTMIGGNFHICTVSGTFEFDQRVGDVEFWRLMPDKDQLEQESKYQLSPCRLRLIVTRQTLAFMDPEPGACHAYFACGARIGVSTVTFKRSTRSQRQSNACQSAS